MGSKAMNEQEEKGGMAAYRHKMNAAKTTTTSSLEPASSPSLLPSLLSLTAGDAIRRRVSFSSHHHVHQDHAKLPCRNVKNIMFFFILLTLPFLHFGLSSMKPTMSANTVRSTTTSTRAVAQEQLANGRLSVPTTIALEKGTSESSESSTVLSEHTSWTVTGVPRSFYTIATTGRSGAVILDMLQAHAFAFAHNSTYLGACIANTSLLQGVSPPPSTPHQLNRLIRVLGLQNLLPLECPAVADQAKSNVLPRSVYSRFNTRLMTAAWREHLVESSSPQTSTSLSTPDVVMHIRRGDVTPCMDEYFRYLPNVYYLRLLQNISMASSQQVVIYSESSSFEPWDAYYQPSNRYELRLDSTLEEAWFAMMHAKVLILSKSSFSLVPALLNRHQVIYTPFWYEKLTDPQWTVVDGNAVRDATRITNRLRRERCNLTTAEQGD